MSDPTQQDPTHLDDATDAPPSEVDNEAQVEGDQPEPEDELTELDRLREENRQLFEKLARTQADYQNAQRRLTKDADQRLKVAAGHLMREILPVVDNLERAAEVPDTADVKSVVNGVRGTLDQLLGVLKTNGVTPIAPEPDTPFDPEHHEALMQEPRDPAPESPVVTRLLQKGYDFDGRVIRPAQVAVSRPA